MKRAVLLLLSAGLWGQDKPASPAPEIRPRFAVQTDITSEYWRQAWVIEHAMALQGEATRKATAFCAANDAELQYVRNDQGLIALICVPKTKAGGASAEKEGKQ